MELYESFITEIEHNQNEVSDFTNAEQKIYKLLQFKNTDHEINTTQKLKIFFELFRNAISPTLELQTRLVLLFYLIERFVKDSDSVLKGSKTNTLIFYWITLVSFFQAVFSEAHGIRHSILFGKRSYLKMVKLIPTSFAIKFFFLIIFSLIFVIDNLLMDPVFLFSAHNLILVGLFLVATLLYCISETLKTVTMAMGYERYAGILSLGSLFFIFVIFELFLCKMFEDRVIGIVLGITIYEILNLCSTVYIFKVYGEDRVTKNIEFTFHRDYFKQLLRSSGFSFCYSNIDPCLVAVIL